jgi:hypothetical protein
LQGLNEVARAAAPSGKLGHQDGVDFARLTERHDLFTLDLRSVFAPEAFFIDADDFEAATPRESAKIA